MTRNYSLDVARGILAWVVVLVHILWISGLSHSGLRATLGWWAVEGFMIIAGYVAAMTYRPESYGRYLTKKVFRLAPVLIVSLFLCWAARTYLDPGWFMILLAQFYLVLPAIMWAIRRFGRRVLFWLLLFSLFCLLPPVYGQLERFAPLGMGEFLPMNLFWFVIGMCAFYLVDQYVLADLSCRAARFPLLVRLGELSYSTYLCQWPLLVLISYLVPRDWPFGPGIVVIAFLGVPVTAAASVCMHRFIELPGIELGRRFLVSHGTKSVAGTA